MSLLKVNSLQDLGADAVVTDGVIASSALPAGSILQVVSATKTDTFTTTSSTPADITGLSASITPSSTSSKIMVILNLGVVDAGASNGVSGDVTRAGTALALGGSSIARGWFVLTNSANRGQVVAWSYLDSPATTSTITYQARLANDSGGTSYVNRNSLGAFFTSSTITLIEVAG